MNTNASPFKFLDSYAVDDFEIWFGREKETQELYDALSGVKHLLVYGPSGAGKTSLIECGLRNQFSDADWHALTIRKGQNISASVFLSINTALENKISLDPKTKLPINPNISFGKAVARLFEERYQPVYLLFDQFEELLILSNGDPEQENERKDFFRRLNELIQFKIPCRVILIMREEFIGHLSDYEHICPSIFQQRFRLEKMRKEGVKEVISNTLRASRFKSFFSIVDVEQLTQDIHSKLPDRRQEIELAHVQVFLEELWERANHDFSKSLPLVLSKELIRKEDNLEVVLDSFLRKQMQALEVTHGKQIPLEVLAAMISKQHTKLQLTEAFLNRDLTANGVKLKHPISALLKELEQRRIIRRYRSGDKTQYEISHDLLAKIIGQSLTEEMKMRSRAEEVYRVFEKRQGLLSQDDLDFLRPFGKYKAIPVILERRMKESETQLTYEHERQIIEANDRVQKEQYLRLEAQNKAQKARQRTQIAVFLAFMAFVIAFWAFSLKNKAQFLTEETERHKVRIQNQLGELSQKEVKLNMALENEKLAKDSIEQQRIIADIATLEAQKQARIAELEYQSAEKERKRAVNLSSSLDEQIFKTNENLRIAKDKTNDLEKSISEIQRVNIDRGKGMIAECLRYIYTMDYNSALFQFKQALELGVKLESAIHIFQELGYVFLVTNQRKELTDLMAVFYKKEVMYDSLKLVQSTLPNLDSINFLALEKKYFPQLERIEGATFQFGIIPSRDQNLKSVSESSRTDYVSRVQKIREYASVYPYKRAKFKTVDDFYLGKTEISCWQFRIYLLDRKNSRDQFLTEKEFLEARFGIAGDNPVINVSFLDALDYCNWLSRKLGLQPVYGSKVISIIPLDARGFFPKKRKLAVPKLAPNANGFRLPYEYEWEYCARGGRNFELFKFPGTDSLAQVGWYSENSGGRIHPIASLMPNNMGIYDLAGNASEWCWEEQFAKPKLRTIKGGNYLDLEKDCQNYAKEIVWFDEVPIGTGFRVAKGIGLQN